MSEKHKQPNEIIELDFDNDNSSSTSSSISKEKRSDVWNHFDKFKDDKGILKSKMSIL
jgi:hypothetical protein